MLTFTAMIAAGRTKVRLCFCRCFTNLPNIVDRQQVTSLVNDQLIHNYAKFISALQIYRWFSSEKHVMFSFGSTERYVYTVIYSRVQNGRMMTFFELILKMLLKVMKHQKQLSIFSAITSADKGKCDGRQLTTSGNVSRRFLFRASGIVCVIFSWPFQ